LSVLDLALEINHTVGSFMKIKILLTSVILASGNLAVASPSLAVILSVPITLNIITSQGSNNATGAYNMDLGNLTFSGTLDASDLPIQPLAFPIIPKAILWGLKILCPPPLPAAPEQPKQTLVDFYFGGNATGTMFDSANNSVGTFQISNNGYIINIDLRNQQAIVPVNSLFEINIAETTNSNQFNQVTSQGFFKFNEDYSESYSINYDSLAVRPINNLVIKLNGYGSLPNDNIITFSGQLFKTPEPTSILSLLSLGILGAGATLKRKVKRSHSLEKEPSNVG